MVTRGHGRERQRQTRSGTVGCVSAVANFRAGQKWLPPLKKETQTTKQEGTQTKFMVLLIPETLTPDYYSCPQIFKNITEVLCKEEKGYPRLNSPRRNTNFPKLAKNISSIESHCQNKPFWTSYHCANSFSYINQQLVIWILKYICKFSHSDRYSRQISLMSNQVSNEESKIEGLNLL